MRCDQFIGLPGKARAYLASHAASEEYDECPHCKLNTRTMHKKEPCGIVYGMFDQPYQLNRYVLKGGGWAEEFEQCSPWSSGPVIFLGLRIFNCDNKVVRDIKWTDAQIKTYL